MSEQHSHYRKGTAKQEEILERALELIGTHGFDDTTLRSIARAVHLSQSGVLHYFSSMDDLYIHILEARDRSQMQLFSAFIDHRQSEEPYDGVILGIPAEKLNTAILIQHFIALNGSNHETPGLMELYARMQIEAANPNHPAHAYFLRRTAMMHRIVEPLIKAANDRGVLAPAWDPCAATSALIAVADGPQLQWLTDHSVDIAFCLTQFFDQLGHQ